MGLGKKTIDDQNYCGKKVLVRCDFNVPMKDGVITNENRINAALPTIQKLVNDGAKVILCSHLGKPKNGPEAKFSLAPVAVALSAKLGKTVVFADDDNVVGENAKAAVAAMNNGDVVLLQNTRFRKEETNAHIEHLISEIRDQYIDEIEGKITISIGICFAPENGSTFMDLYRCADRALYQTKQNGRDGYTFYTK